MTIAELYLYFPCPKAYYFHFRFVSLKITYTARKDYHKSLDIIPSFISYISELKTEAH